MELEASLPFALPTGEAAVRRWFYVVVAVPTGLEMAHHLVRGNHVGWPTTGDVNEFTYKLTIYPLVAAGPYLTSVDRVGHRFCAWFLAFTALLVGYFHLSPWAVEPPGDVVLPYANPVVGYLAFAVLLALVASAVVGSAVMYALWRRAS